MSVASLASRCPEHASPRVPGERDGALIPCEKRAPRAHPVRQHAPTPARMFTGTDTGYTSVCVSLSCWHTLLLCSSRGTPVPTGKRRECVLYRFLQVALCLAREGNGL